jgi:hypothetical protein
MYDIRLPRAQSADKFVCMKAFHRIPPRLEARVAGVLYLFSMVLGVTGGILVRSKMQVQGDRANLAAAIVYTGVTVLLWDLFRPVNESLSTGVAIFSVVANWLPESYYKMAHTSITLYFGVYCLLISYLILRSKFLPNYVGVLMAFAGACWLTTNWPWLASIISPYNELGGLVGEGTLTGYLLIKGLDERKWKVQAGLV